MGTTHSTDTYTSSSIETSFQNLSLNSGSGTIISGCGGGGAGAASGAGGNYQLIISSESVGSNFSHRESSQNHALELNSHIRMPYQWEQCLDVQTGEVYYVNWKTGVRTKEDPRKMSFFRREESGEESELDLDDILSLDSSEIDQAMQEQGEEEEEEVEDDSSSLSSTTTTTNTALDEFAAASAAAIPAGDSPPHCHPTYLHPFWEREAAFENPGGTIMNTYYPKNQEVLVLAGCKWCYLYFMVPKQVEECPKCSGQLLRFDPLDGQSINYQ